MVDALTLNDCAERKKRMLSRKEVTYLEDRKVEIQNCSLKMWKYGMIKPKGEVSRRGLCKIQQSGCISQDRLNDAVVTNPNSYWLNTAKIGFFFMYNIDHWEERDHQSPSGTRFRKAPSGHTLQWSLKQERTWWNMHWLLTLPPIVTPSFHSHFINQPSHTSVSNMAITTSPRGWKRTMLPCTQKKK